MSMWSRLFSRPEEAKTQRTQAEIWAMLDGQQVDSRVGAITETNAMTQATVWACVRILSESIAQLPISVQERNSGKWSDIDHDVLGLLAAPNAWQTQHEFLSQMVAWMELRGNAYALKKQGTTGIPRELIVLDATNVEPTQDENWKIEYKYGGNPVPTRRMMHMRNFGTSGFKGLSTVENARNVIGLALTMEDHGTSVFVNGAQSGLVLKAPNMLDDESYDRMKRRWEDGHAGSKNAHKTRIIEGGLDIKEIGLSNEASQWLDSRKFSKSEIATIFGIPDFMLNSTDKSTTWGSGLEQLSRSFVRFTLQPRMSRIVQTLNHSLLDKSERGRMRFVFDTDQMTMGEFESRMTGYSTAIMSGVLSANEAREIEGRNPRDGGDEYLTPMNMTTGEDDGNTGTTI